MSRRHAISLLSIWAARCRISCSRSGTTDCAFSVAEHNGVARSASARTKPVWRDMWGSLACSNIEKAAVAYHAPDGASRLGHRHWGRGRDRLHAGAAIGVSCRDATGTNTMAETITIDRSPVAKCL